MVATIWFYINWNVKWERNLVFRKIIFKLDARSFQYLSFLSIKPKLDKQKVLDCNFISNSLFFIITTVWKIEISTPKVDMTINEKLMHKTCLLSMLFKMSPHFKWLLKRATKISIAKSKFCSSSISLEIGVFRRLERYQAVFLELVVLTAKSDR